MLPCINVEVVVCNCFASTVSSRKKKVNDLNWFNITSTEGAPVEQELQYSYNNYLKQSCPVLLRYYPTTCNVEV